MVTKDSKLTIGVLATTIAWLVIAVVWYVLYPFPGKEASFLGFIALFLRELLLVGIMLVLVLLAIGKLFILQHSKRRD